MKTSTAQWLRDARWGLFFHYLDSPASSEDVSFTSSQDWNARIESFDVARFASQVAGTGAGYVIWTLGQNSGHYCAPNATYDSITNIRPSKCSKRDLLGEIADELACHGIKTIAYLPSGAPQFEEQAVTALRWRTDENDTRQNMFQRHWENIIREWSMRWGNRVSGWWIDGCYWPEQMYFHDDAPNLESFIGALKAGNGDAIVAFNRGPAAPVKGFSPLEDYTAGETSEGLPLSVEKLHTTSGDANSSDENSPQFHVLVFAGESWGRGEPRFDAELVRAYTHFINERNGAVTWDIPIGERGEIPEAFLGLLQSIDMPQRASVQAGIPSTRALRERPVEAMQ
ncbi:MAG TPA: alpha-L-fucosidase [Abditibacteriaceae bacterium]|jgi:hypothetical protein